jgi:hypothetical protein
VRIYAYTVVGRDSDPWERQVGSEKIVGTGLIKVGQTGAAAARTRIRQQLRTAYPNLEGVKILLDEPATREDGTEFTDGDVHRVLVSAGIRRPGGEWFEATLDEVKAAINAVRTRKRFDAARTDAFAMRPEQKAAVETTAAYFRQHAGPPVPKFLWNAKMRFGKTFTTYQLAREMGWNRVLVLTYKPAVQSQWRDDLLNHVDFDGWSFVERETEAKERSRLFRSKSPLVCFASFQDLMGRSEDGQVKTHNEAIHRTRWDVIAIDEYHFGAWRESARDLYDPEDRALAEVEEPTDWTTDVDVGLKARHFLYLSGTPFRAITNGEFAEDAMFNWTYVDEQAAKDEWTGQNNPYGDLPRMELFAYEIAPGAAAWAADGEFNAFSLNELFSSKRIDGSTGIPSAGSYVFDDPTQVSEFLAMLRGKLSDQMKVAIVTGQRPPFPYESANFQQAVTHSVWYLPDVASCYAMRDALAKDPFFNQLEVVVVAGSYVGQGAAAKPPVEAAIGAARKAGTGSITLTCGKLMTGVTVREWGAIFMLRSLKSPETYFQAAFRVQSPWAHRDAEGNLAVEKPTCYVFEFDPNRALSLIADYGIRLASRNESTPAEAIGQLLNYLPIFGFAGGQMTQLDASAILDWATAGVGATALAQRWNSPLLVEVNERTLGDVLRHDDLMERLAQVEDFRTLVSNAPQVVTSTKLLKQARREQGALSPDQRREADSTARLRREIREKLQKFLAKIPIFMYVTDFREEAVKHVIESLDSELFERVTGLTVNDFKVLCDLGLFNTDHMNSAIYQFKLFETASLHYADGGVGLAESERIGLWDREVDS